MLSLPRSAARKLNLIRVLSYRLGAQRSWEARESISLEKKGRRFLILEFSYEWTYAVGVGVHMRFSLRATPGNLLETERSIT